MKIAADAIKLSQRIFQFIYCLYIIRMEQDQKAVNNNEKSCIWTTPHCTGIGPDEWIYCLVVVLVGSCLRDSGPGGCFTKMLSALRVVLKVKIYKI